MFALDLLWDGRRKWPLRSEHDRVSDARGRAKTPPQVFARPRALPLAFDGVPARLRAI